MLTTRRRVGLGLILVAVLTGPLGAQAAGSHAVRGYTTRTGVTVAPHRATNPDRSRANNWSSAPNVNPYTGREGKLDPNRPQVRRR